MILHKSSSLSKQLGDDGVDPIELEKAGKAFIVNSDVDRNDTEAVLRYLRNKYKSDDLVKINMKYLSLTTVIPKT